MWAQDFAWLQNTGTQSSDCLTDITCKASDADEDAARSVRLIIARMIGDDI